MDFSIIVVGDAAIKVQFMQDVTPQLNRKIKAFCKKINALAVEGIVELVPAFNSVTIYYQPIKISYYDICKKLCDLSAGEVESESEMWRIIKVPVLYGGTYGPDLERVATYNRLSIEEVIVRHQEPDYLVYMLGFLPGFPYLGGLVSELTTPRLEKPRKSVPAGSVGIAHKQTGVYPIESPGGWNIIGKTPLRLVNLKKENQPFLFDAGDVVQFYEVNEATFLEIEEAVYNDSFEVEVKHMERGDM